MQLLQAPQLTLLRRRVDGTEPLAASPLVATGAAGGLRDKVRVPFEDNQLAFYAAPGRAGSSQPMFDAAWSALFTKDGTPRKQLRKVGALAATQAALAAFAAQGHQLDAHTEHLRMVRVARLLLAELAAYKRTRGLADMADLARCGLAPLRDATLAGWVQERLDARIRHVLIDEFQDTSPLQWHALHAWLGTYAGASGGASGQRPRGVFIVGDPKQTLYRFRHAARGAGRCAC